MVKVRRSLRLFPLVLVPLLLVSACAQDGSSALGGPKQTFGTAIGAGAGGLIGSQFGHGTGKVFSTLGGAAIGGLLGNLVGRRLDDIDRQRAADAARRALASREATSVRWTNPESGNSGTVTTRPIHYEPRTPANSPASTNPPSASANAPSPSRTPSMSTNDSNSAMLDNPSGSNGVSPASVDRSLGTRQTEASATVACRTAVSTVKLKDDPDAQVTESKFCRQPDGTWAPVTS